MDNKLLLKDALELNEVYENIIHDIKTPITVIYSVIELMQSCINNPSMLNENLDILTKNTLRVIKLVNDIHDFNKISHGNFKPNLKCHDIVSLTEEAVTSIKVTLRNKKRNIKIISSVKRRNIFIDKTLYERMFFNILINAIKFTDEGGNISIYLEEDEGFFVLRVCDDGIGISTKMNSERLFSRYSVCRKNSNSGSGLGLNIVKELVEILNGSINIYNNIESAGATVLLSIPYNNLAEIEEYDLFTYIYENDLYKNNVQQIELSTLE